jgi:hypothetical protein
MNTAILTRNLKSAKLNAVLSSVRHGGHFLKKNIWVEENAGLRENTYKTWKFTMARSIKIFAFLILPGVVFYSACIEEEVYF